MPSCVGCKSNPTSRCHHARPSQGPLIPAGKTDALFRKIIPPRLFVTPDTNGTSLSFCSASWFAFVGWQVSVRQPPATDAKKKQLFVGELLETDRWGFLRGSRLARAKSTHKESGDVVRALRSFSPSAYVTRQMGVSNIFILPIITVSFSTGASRLSAGPLVPTPQLEKRHTIQYPTRAVGVVCRSRGRQAQAAR